jgi:hypothetical protein
MKEALCSPKSRFLQEPHGVTSQKTPFFIVTAVKTSNLSKTIFGKYADLTGIHVLTSDHFTSTLFPAQMKGLLKCSLETFHTAMSQPQWQMLIGKYSSIFW